jgi:hypothetical protein
MWVAGWVVRRRWVERAGPQISEPAQMPRGLEWLGARIDLADSPAGDPHAVFVEAELFSNGTVFGTAQARLRPDQGRPVAIPTDDFEAALRRMIASRWLPQLARVLRDRGIQVGRDDLAQLPLVVELAPALQRRLAEKAVPRTSDVH